MNSDYSINQDYLLSSIPAKWIDQLVLYSPRLKGAKTPKQIAAMSLSLAISATVFPLFLSMDCTFYSGKFLAESVGAKISSDPLLKDRAKKHQKTAEKCFRGLTTFPAGIFWRNVVSNHFVPPPAPDRKVHPTGGLYAAFADQRFPRSAQEVQQIVLEAKRDKKPVSIAGAGYSQGKQALPSKDNDIRIEMKQINHVRIDREKKTAIIGAGATWAHVQNQADKEDLAVQVMQASAVFSIGGSLSANCHGWDHTQGPVANTVNWVKIVTPEGELRTLTPQDELFGYVLGGYGLFGVIVEAEIQLTDNEKLSETAKPVPISDYVAHFRNEIQTDPAIKLHLYRLSLEKGKLLQRGWSQSYRSTSPEKGQTDHLEEEPPRGMTKERVLMQVARCVPESRTLWWKQEEKTMRKEKVQTRNAFMRAKINAAFANPGTAQAEWLQEYFVPEEKLSSFLPFLANILNQNDVALFNASVRFVKQDTHAQLGYATGGDRFAIVLFFSQSLNKKEIEKTRAWVQKVIDHLAEIEGTFYLPYMHFASPTQFKQCYPKWQGVLAKKQEYDPANLFDSGFFEDYFTNKETNP